MLDNHAPNTPLTDKNHLIRTSRLVVRAAILINRLFFAAVLLGLILSTIFSTQFAALLLHQDPSIPTHAEITGLRLMMFLGLAMAIGTEVLLAALAQIIASAGAGDPFISANARKLQTIGWALLFLQLLAFPAFLIEKFFPGLGTAAPDSSFSPGGWIAVLMVFVLSRVFAAGSAMRDDLEGTV